MIIERIQPGLSSIVTRDEAERAENKRRNVLGKDAVSLEDESARREDPNAKEQRDNTDKAQDETALTQQNLGGGSNSRGPLLDIVV